MNRCPDGVAMGIRAIWQQHFDSAPIAWAFFFLGDGITPCVAFRPPFMWYQNTWSTPNRIFELFGADCEVAYGWHQPCLEPCF